MKVWPSLLAHLALAAAAVFFACLLAWWVAELALAQIDLATTLFR